MNLLRPGDLLILKVTLSPPITTNETLVIKLAISFMMNRANEITWIPPSLNETKRNDQAYTA